MSVLDKDGIRIGFVGVVTNYEGPGHPAGNASSFEGLEFPDPQAMAMKYAAELRPKVDLLVLVSHMGDDRDVELLGRSARVRRGDRRAYPCEGRFADGRHAPDTDREIS